MEFVIYYNEYRPYYEASILICIGAVCAAAFERVFKHRWLAIHRTAVRQAAIALYISFCNAALERIPLDVMHELSDPKRLRELQSGHLSQDE